MIRKRISESGSFKIISDHDTTINTIPSYQIRATAQDSREQVYVELVFLNYHEMNFQLTGMSLISNRSLVQASLTSFRKITDSEAASVKLQTVSIQSGTNGESIEEFSKRTNNAFNSKLTALINALADDATLKEGELMKTLKVELYLK